MAKRIEAWGNVLEFPDDMPDADIASAIQKNEANLNPGASTFTKAKSAVSGGIDAGLAMLTPKPSISERAQEQPALARDAARIQRSRNIVSKALASTEPVPEEGGFINSVGRTVGQNIKGAGQIGADFIPGVGQDNAVKRFGQDVIDANPTAVNSLEDIADKPGTAVTEATGNAAPSMAGMVGARALGQGITALSPIAGPAAPVVAAVGQVVSWLGPAAIASLPSYGGIRDKQILDDPKNEESAKAKAVAALGAGAVGAIEQAFGPQQWALAALTKEGRVQLAKKFAATSLPGAIGKGVVKGAAIEGAEELAQNPIEQLAAFDNPTTPENVKDTLFGGAMGAIGGGVLGGGIPVIAGKPVTDHSDNVLKYTAARGSERAKAAAQAELNRRATQGVDPAVANAPESTSEAVDRIISTGKDKADEIRQSAASEPDAIQSSIFGEPDHAGDVNAMIDGTGTTTLNPVEKQEVAPDAPTPEPVETLNAQLNALAAGNKPGMLLTPGEPMPAALPEGVQAADIPGRGTLLYRDDAILQAALNGQMGTALGYGIDEKPDGADHVVTARDENGTVIQDVATDGNPQVEQAAAAVAGPDGSVEVRPIEHAMVERGAKALKAHLEAGKKPRISTMQGAEGSTQVIAHTGVKGEQVVLALTPEEQTKYDDVLKDMAWADTSDGRKSAQKAQIDILRPAMNRAIAGIETANSGEIDGIKTPEPITSRRPILAGTRPETADLPITPAKIDTGNPVTASNQAVAPATESNLVESQPIKTATPEPTKSPRITGKNDKPFATKTAASAAILRQKQKPSDFDIKQVEGGFVAERKASEPVVPIGQPEPKSPVRPLVESLIKRRAAAKQGGKDLSNAIARAKEILDGKREPSPVENRWFRLQAKAFERADQESAKILRQISDAIKGGEELKNGRKTDAEKAGTGREKGSILGHGMADGGRDRESEKEGKGSARGGSKEVRTPQPSNEVLRKDGPKFSRTPNKQGIEFANEVLTELAGVDELFRYPLSHKTSLKGVFEDVYNGAEYIGDGTREDERQESGADHRYVFKSPQGKQFYVYERDNGEVFIDVSHFEKGEGGQAVYAAVANYAFNANKRFIADPAGLTADSLIRRTSNMLSAALRFGTTKHLDAAPQQIAGDPKNGVEPLDWSGDDLAKTHALIHTFITTLHNKLPSIKNAKYDFSQGEFLNRLGVPLNREAFQRIADSGVGQQARAGEATMRRGILIQSLISGKGGSRSGILEQVLNRSRSLVRRGKLEGIFSRHKASQESKQATLPGGLSVSEVEKLIAPLQADGFKKINIAATEADLPPSIKKQITSRNAQGVRGVYLPETDEIWLVADRLNNDLETIMVTLHEARHRGLRKLFGPGISPIMRQIYATNKRVRDAADTMMKSVKGMSKEEATEEVLADMSIDRARALNGWKKLVRFIKQWIAEKFNLTFTDEMVETLVAGAEVAGMAEKEVSLFDDKQAGSYAEAADGEVFTPQTETLAFKKWFGKSKIVNADGSPKVFYHGTDQSFDSFDPKKGGTGTLANDAKNAMFFTSSSDVAEDFSGHLYHTPDGETVERKFATGANLMPVYLKAENPAIWDMGGGGYTDNFMLDAIKDAKKNGNDSVIFTNMRDGSVSTVGPLKKSHIVVVFRPTQIKSAVGNNGNFDGSNPDIRFSLAPGSNASWDAPEPSKIDDLIYKLQNKHVDLKRVLEAVRNAGVQLADKWNTYLQEELFHGRAAKRTQDFVNKELKPIIAGMKLRGLTVDELDKYLHARHAEEANDLIAQRDPNMPDGGSGMSTKDAQDYLANLPADKQRKLAQVAAKVDAVIAATRNLYVSYGLVDKDTADAWAIMFQHYVPLMREDHDGGMGVGQGFSIKGKEVKHRTGSRRAVVDILANIALQRERAIVRGEKNRVAVSLAGLAKMNPNPDFWTFDKVPTEKVLNEATGQVEERPVPNFKSRDNVVVAKIKDSKGKVQERAVIFNEKDERAMRMAQALKNLDATQLEGLLGVSAKITRYFASINTQYNPVFGIVNLTRDLQASLLNLSSTPIAGHKAQVLKNVLPAIRAIYSSTRGDRKGKQATSPMAALWDEMQQEGGMTGYRDLFKTSEDRANAIKHELDPTAWMNSGMGKIFTAGGALKVPMAIAQKRAGWLFDWLSDYNQTLEGAMRLSVYKTAIDNGISKQRAASLAKNISVNFNRKGQSGQQAGALYAFFNAAMQGTARIGETMTTMEKGDIKTLRFNRAGKRIIAGGIALGAMQALALAAAGFDDDEPPEFVRERSLIIPIGDKKYITVPMPLGFHAIPNIGRLSTEFALGGFKKPAEYTVKLFSVFAEAFNPIGNAGMSLQTIAFTPLDPLAALAENRDWTGKPIYKEDFSKLSPTPGFSRNKDTASDPAKWIAEAINTISGGNKYVPGMASPTADQIDYLFGQVTGGVGREASKMNQSIRAGLTGEDLPPHKIPLVGRFYGNSENQSSQGNAFYSNLKRINEVEAELKGRRKDHLPLDEFKAENPEYRLVERANLMERLVSKQRKLKSELIEKDAPKDQVKVIDERITKLMAGFNQRVKDLRQEAR